jgi:hypothetical protein
MKRKVLVALVATLVVGFGATGTVLYVQHRAEVQRAEAAAAKERAAERERREAVAAAKAAHEECVAATEDYLSAVQDIDAVVSVGVSYDDYSDLVRDAAIAQRRMGTVAPRCTSGVVEPLDEALDQYTEASSEWNDCIFDSDFSCDVDDLDLSSGWLLAGASLLTAEEFVGGAGGDAA